MTLPSLGITRPIIQAPMAGVQDSALAIAVAKAGGLGSLPCAMLSPSQLEDELSHLQTAVDTPINLNFFCHQLPVHQPEVEAAWIDLLKPYFLELGIDSPEITSGKPSRQPFSHAIADIIEPYTPKIISFHFGLPERELLNRLKGWGTLILSTATTVAEAKWLEANGADMVIAQGIEAGGHRGMFLSEELSSQSPTVALVANITEQIKLPVIAAGGIGSADEVVNMLDIGAIGVQIGTAYLLCNEAKTSLLHREKIQQQTVPKTMLTNVFTGRAARGIVNRAMNELGPISQSAPQFPLAAAAISLLRNAAEAGNSTDFTPLWCGQNTYGCETISAFDLTQKLTVKIQ